MRELKFRVWDSKQNLMILPEYADWEDFFINADGTVSRMIETGIYESYRSEKSCDKDFVVMQFTGLKDKNGVEIYEGDILKHKSGFISGVTCVYAGKGHFYISPYHFEDNAMVNEDFFIKQTEVIGNIYENKELYGK